MIIDNENLVLKDVLKDWIDKSDEVMICSPFITSNDILFDLMERKIKLTIICRLSYPASPDLFSKLLSFSNKDKSIFVFDDNSLHSKIYFFKKNDKRLAAIIGSSNFTDSGIYSNKEYNLLITTELDKVEDYFKHLLKESFSKLDTPTIDYYKTFYKPIDSNDRYKRAKISKKLSVDYYNTLEKFYIAKGFLEKENTTDLPFTYIFDSFCHYFKVYMVKDYDLKEYNQFNKDELKKYFKLFISKYLTQDDLKWRSDRLIESQNIRNNLHTLKSNDIKDFFLGIHSIVSGSGIRIQNIKTIDKTPLIDLLYFLISSSLSMPHKYSIALTAKDKNGLKVDYIGESAVGEIPGWLIPEKYPIKNGKLHYILDFFKI